MQSVGLSLPKTAVTAKKERRATKGPPDPPWKRPELLVSVLSLLVAVGGFVYQTIQLEQVKRDVAADALSLVVQADQVLASPGVQDQLRFIGGPLDPLVGDPGDCQLSHEDEVALRKAATLLTAALTKQPDSQPALDRILVIARALKAPELLADLERAATYDSEAAIRLRLTIAPLRLPAATIDDELARAGAIAQPSDRLVSDMAWVYDVAGRSDESIRLLTRWQSLRDPSPRLSFELGSLLARELYRHPERAEQAIRIARSGVMFTNHQM